MIFSELRVFLSASPQKGIGRRLFELVKADNTTASITVNSSPYAVEVYRYLGFTPTALDLNKNVS